VSVEPGVPAGGGDQRELVAWLGAVIEAKDAENAVLRAELEAQLERYRRLELRVAERERRLGSDSTTSGAPPSKDPVRARERRKAERRARQSPERERRAGRKRGGQPGHLGAGLSRDPDPDERGEVPPPAECSRCGTALDGADRAGSWWSQVRDVRITTFAAEYLLPLLACRCCGKVNAARAPPWAHPGSVSCGPGINAAAVLLSSYGNVPAERAANLIGMLLGVPVSPGFVDGASERLSSRLDGAGFDEAMQAALGAEPVLAADETPVNLLDPRAGLARGDPELDEQLLAELRERYDQVVAFGITHNRLRDWHEGGHPGYALGCWLRDCKEQVRLFTTRLAGDWTDNCPGQAVKAAKRHQAVSGYWHTPRTLARWCRIRSCLDSAAYHGLTALDAITRALAGDPWLPLPQCHVEARCGPRRDLLWPAAEGGLPRLRTVAVA
jgi:transposase IS66 family protein